MVTKTGPVALPIKSSHVYLGVKISYHHFERQTTQYRLQQSWQAFHRLSSFLCSQQIPLQQRLQLWKTCVQSIARYGLDSVGLDEVSASKHRAHTTRQLRRIADSMGHLTHETNHDLHVRLGVPDPVRRLYDMVISRVKASKHHSGHLHSQIVAQRLVSLVSDMTNHRQPTVQQKGELTEVTQVLRVACSCDICGQQFASFHALRTHIGKSHPETSIALTKENYSVRSERKDSHTRHAQSGLPQCNKCGKQFSGWPAFMSHFNQQACPVLHNMSREADISGQEHSLACGTFASEGVLQSEQIAEYVPVFGLTSTAEVAKTGILSQIASHLRQFGKPDKCPECGMHCNPMYISRHACKQHSWISQVNARVIEWVRNSQIPSSLSTRPPTRHTAMLAQSFGCAVTSYISTPPSHPQIKVHFMATVGNEELARAAEELDSFKSFMTPSPAATPTTLTGSQPFQEMTVDQTAKRGGENDDMDKEAQERAKWHRGLGKGYQKSKGRPNQNPRQEQKSWWEAKDQRGYSKNSEAELKSVVKALGRLVLRQEDSLSVMHLDSQYVIFMKNKSSGVESMQDWSVTAQLLSVGSHWKDRKEREPQSLSQPLRTVLFSSWLTAIKFRIGEIKSNPATREQAVKMGILEDENFPYLQWSPEESKRIKVQQAPLSMTDALQVVDQLQSLIIHPNTIGGSTRCVV